MIAVPSLIYTASEISSYNENEELLAQVYKQQLDVILFSINQYAWDYLNSWTSKLDVIAADELFKDKNNSGIQSQMNKLNSFIAKNTFLKQVSFYDLSFRKIATVSSDDELSPQITSTLDSFIQKNKDALQKLPSIKKQDYRKIEPFVLDTGSLSSCIGLAYISDFKDGSVYTLLVIDSDVFISNAISNKLNELAGANLACAVFDEKTKIAKTSTQDLAYDDAIVREKLWIFPNHSLAIGFSGFSLSEFTNQRLLKSIFLILAVNLVLVIGVWFVYKNTRKEMQLAQLKSDFVSNVSHELRTPLSLIRMYSETLEMDRVSTDKKKMEYYKNISHEAERLTHLINNILNFSRMESGKKEYTFNEVDINTLIENVLATYKDSIYEQGFTLEQDITPENPHIQADEAAVSENLINLIDNALKYSNNEKYIKISSSKNNTDVLIIVEDHGAGIALENQQKVFDKFYRETTALIHNTKGSGLGLTLVKHNMQAHKGDVKLESTPGKGSRFILRFPLNRSDNV
jgi:two-component system, OmpR family, phosphate regulon sensor histidine kinase PhoR